MLQSIQFKREIVAWHSQSPESRPWLKILFPDADILFLESEVGTGCWLTRSPNGRTVPIVPYHHGGTEHPKNHVILNRGLLHKAPEEKNPEAFLNWLTGKAIERRARFKRIFNKVFNNDPEVAKKFLLALDQKKGPPKNPPEFKLPKGIPPNGLEAGLLRLKHQMETYG
jgi:hypothetical protein